MSVMERLKLLQTGTVAFQETNLEWHNKGYRDEFKNTFGQGLWSSEGGLKHNKRQV
jgi:hypothetical protein